MVLGDFQLYKKRAIVHSKLFDSLRVTGNCDFMGFYPTARGNFMVILWKMIGNWENIKKKTISMGSQQLLSQ